ncbi:cytidine deaminase [Oceanisphaera avium]|uniref:Cytidine deaminase n=1 Tax=Oceanisphaera avium TaxID=1903694 RepID=A0A1Y0CVF6_9GAMM|nr:cytidine deaminase [Oceanisphaera avium]ART79198.1 cytidine deaminase [Oceanisphaera avium]
MSDTLAKTLEQHRLSHVIRYSPEQVQLLLETCDLGTDALAFALLEQAKTKAHTPISKLQVSALVIGGSGYWYLGANLEFAHQSLSHTVHAEQAAVGHAMLWDEQHLEKIFISHAPCGQCRQFLQELNQTSLLVSWPEHYAMLEELLPHAFNPAQPAQSNGLLTSSNTSLLASQQGMEDALTLMAWDQASASYAPYTGNYAGVVLLLTDGQICHGRYLENSGFNPSLGPLHLALSQLYLQGYQACDIERAVLVEASAGISQANGCIQLLASLGAPALERVTVSTSVPPLALNHASDPSSEHHA